MAILPTAVNAKDILRKREGYYSRLLLCGDSGSGKTTSAMSAPGRKLLIDMDGRQASIAGFNVEVLDCTLSSSDTARTWLRLEDARKELWSLAGKDKVFPYSAVIWDGTTAMTRISMKWALLRDPGRGLGGTPAQQHYFPQMPALSNYIISTLGLPCHVIYTAHLDLLEDTSIGSIRFLPKITGKLRTEVAAWFDETYLCKREPAKDGNMVYMWMTAGSGRMSFLKSSLNRLGGYWSDPVIINPDEAPWGLSKLLEIRFGGKGGDNGKKNVIDLKLKTETKTQPTLTPKT